MGGSGMGVAVLARHLRLRLAHLGYSLSSRCWSLSWSLSSHLCADRRSGVAIACGKARKEVEAHWDDWRVRFIGPGFEPHGAHRSPHQSLRLLETP
ncbi:hypothetical protein SBBP2_1430001 [Burkholderiales bacterium]|nr:hypothetical protein SBBP2_1430001 [Burkholderiales bacterium]